MFQRLLKTLMFLLVMLLPMETMAYVFDETAGLQFDVIGETTDVAVSSSFGTSFQGISAEALGADAVLPDSVRLNYHEITLVVGETLQLTAGIFPDDVTDPTLTWVTSNSKVAVVDKGGLVRGVAAGKCMVRATCGAQSDICTITVVQSAIYAESITLNSSAKTLQVNESFQLSASVLPKNVTDPTVTWTTSDGSIAMVDANGIVTAIGSGECEIIATCGKVRSVCAIKVEEPIVLPESVTLDIHEATIKVGETLQLTANVLPENVTDPTLTWHSSYYFIADVDQNGLVTALLPGRSEIVVKCGDKIDVCLVVVEPGDVLPKSVTLNSHSETLQVNGTVQLTATVLPENVTDPTLVWTSSDEAVATVDANGLVTAIAPGECVITVTCGDKSDACAITVETPVVLPESVTLNTHSETLQVNGTVQLTATILPTNVTDPTLVWTSSDESVATVDANGLVTAIAPGECVITVTCGDKSDACTITVETPVVLPESVTLNSHSETLQVNGTVQLTATVLPENVTDPTLVWTSSDETVATVDANGLVTAIAPGECVITVACGDKSDACAITVETPVVLPESVTLDIHEATINVEETLQLTATILPENVTDPTLVWTSSDETVATVDANGLVTAIAPGECVITVTCGDKSDACTITVETPVVLPESVTLNTHSETLQVNGTLQLTATVLPENVTDPTLVWTSSDETVATVDANGLVTAIAPGECVITVTCGDKSDACTITVETPVVLPESVTLDIHEATINVEETLQLTATVLPENVTDPTLVWTSSDETVATVDANGLVTAIAPGECVITVTCGDKSDACTITVETPVVLPESVTLNSHSETLQVNETVQLTATVLPENVTDPTLVWTSSDETVATVDANGLVTAIAPGECVITVTCGDVSDACTITVEAPVVLPESVTLNSHSETLQVNETVQLTATVLPENVTDPTLVWTSSDESVATVDANGLVTAIAPGECVITVTCGDKSDACAITVETPVVLPESVTLDIHEATINVEETLQLTATILPENVTDPTLVWTSSDETVATVDANGLVTAIAPGECVITVTCGDKSDACTITVEIPVVLPESVTLTPSEATMYVGDTLDLVATILPENVTDPTLVWSSSYANIATVDNQGKVTAIAEGECDITATCGDKSAVAHIIVNSAGSTSDIVISLDQHEVKLDLQKKVTLIPKMTPFSTSLAVTSSDSTLLAAYVVNGTVLLEGKGIGKAIVRVSSTDGRAHADSCSVRISSYLGDANLDGFLSISDVTSLIDALLGNKSNAFDPYFADIDMDGMVNISDVSELIDALLSGMDAVFVIVPESVELSEGSAMIAKGESITLQATILPLDVTINTVSWSTSDAKVAKVSQDGEVTGVAAGECDIIATSRDKSSVCHVKVYEVTPERVELSEDSVSLHPTETFTLTATVYPEEAANAKVTWTSTKTSVARVYNGKITAVAVGECDIIATCQGVQDTCHVTVLPVPVESITLDINNAEMMVGDILTLTATITPSNATNKTVTWKSTDTKIAKVSAGKVTAVAVGECDIIATCQSLTDTCHVLVKDENTFVVNGVTFQMIVVDGGKFTMGAPNTETGSSTWEKPQHEVTLSTYKIGQTEVTQELWQAVMGYNKSIFRGDPKLPVENVSWEDCQVFLDSLNALTGMNFRLPTEAEWEFAARGGTKSKGYLYSGSNSVTEVAWNMATAGDTTHPVATKAPNELGLYDMSGNVSEWTNDWYATYPSTAQVDPQGPATGNYKVYRNGSWRDNASSCRNACRYMREVSYNLHILGFRLAL